MRDYNIFDSAAWFTRGYHYGYLGYSPRYFSLSRLLGLW